MSSVSTISGAIKWTGLATGTDFASVVDKLVQIERRVITRQETWKSQWQQKLTAINNLNVRLGSLKQNAQDYDTRDELLSRKAASSKEDVATITNTSTAATGVYNVTVGENIQEKLGSKTYSNTAQIGSTVRTDSQGRPIDANNKIIGTADPEDANVMKAVATALGVDVTDLAYDGGTVPPSYSQISTSTPLAEFDGTTITKISDSSAIAALNGDGVFADTGNNVIATADTAAFQHKDLTITMGGKTLTLKYDESGSLLDGSGNIDMSQPHVGLYHEKMTMAQLAQAINDTVAADPTANPDISAAVVYDKTRTGGTESRLVITGGEGGSKNHITVSDPTKLSMDKASVDAPVTTAWLGCNATPQVDASSAYTGHTNKTITVVTTKATGKGILGTDEITFGWADTEGHSGTFVVKGSDWDAQNDCLKTPIELLQGVKLSFKGGPGDNFMNKDQAFSIDCQTPVMQKAADNGLAQTDKWVHQGVSDLVTPVSTGSGKFVYSYGGKEYSVTLNGDVTLQGLVDKINTDSHNPGVMASVLNDGMGTATSYKLVLTGRQAGAEWGIRVLDSTSLSKMPTGPGTWNHAREASNSMSRIDGYPDDGVSWIQRQGNEVGDVIDGVVITLQGAGTTQITVQNNVTEMVQKIKQLVESVNFCKSYIKEQTQWSGGKLVSKVLEDGTFVRTTEGAENAGGVMIGNYGFQISQSNIDRLMTKEVFTREEYILALDGGKPGKYSKLPVKVADEEKDGPSQTGMYNAYLEKHGLKYTRLSDIGIASDPSNKGQYIVESTKLTEALTKNPEAVIKLFTFKPGDDEGFPEYRPYADENPRPGISGFAVGMGYAMGDLTRTADVIDKDTGKVIKPAKGITVVLAENYNNIIYGINGEGGIDAKIAREEKRIAMVKDRLTEKFSRLETLLANLNNQQTRNEAALSKLSSGDK